MMTPVENGSTSCIGQASMLAIAAQVVSASAMPDSAGARVRVAGVDHQRADASVAGEMAPADRDRRRAEAVLREHARGDGSGLEQREHDVVALPVLDPAGRGAERHARDGQQVFRARRGIADGHGQGRLWVTPILSHATRQSFGGAGAIAISGHPGDDTGVQWLRCDIALA